MPKNLCIFCVLMVGLSHSSFKYIVLERGLKSFHLPYVEQLVYVLELFDNYMQQDAHEFLNYLLNTIGDLLQGMRQVHTYEYLFRNYFSLLHFFRSFANPQFFSYSNK